MPLYVKCQIVDCNEVATWKTGTWWLCEEHFNELPQFRDGNQILTAFGSSYKRKPCKAEDYWLGSIPEGAAVEVEDEL